MNFGSGAGMGEGLERGTGRTADRRGGRAARRADGSSQIFVEKERFFVKFHTNNMERILNTVLKGQCHHKCVPFRPSDI
jgi:hypothetical protein